MALLKIKTTPFDDQKMGTAGLRKRTKIYMQENYLENFIQTAFDVRNEDTIESGNSIKSIVLGGDGRSFCKEAVYKSAKILLANGVEKIYMPKDGLIFTPAHSYYTIKLKTDGGFIFSASHNPGGLGGDFGVKVNSGLGGGVLNHISDEISKRTLTIKEYLIEDISDEELLMDSRVEIIDPISDYADYMEELFDFNSIRELIKGGFNAIFDGMNASSGEYLKEIFGNRLGFPEESFQNCIPMEDFGGKHPEPNLIYAKYLYDFQMTEKAVDFACAFDGDGDRNMVLGKGFFINSSDALAILARHIHLIPAYKDGCIGVARTMPTSSACDFVAKELNIESYQTPTGWRYFERLLDSNKINICGEESFGTSSNHIREKDGVWAVLSWLNIIAKTGKSIEELAKDMWNTHGRVFYSQYSYEEIEKDGANKLIDRAFNFDGFVGMKIDEYKVVSHEIFNYKDPVSGEEAKNQGVQFILNDKDGKNVRVFTRLSGTGTVGATLRMYVEKHETDVNKFNIFHTEYLNEVFEIVDRLLKISEFTGRKKADVYN